jgi:hypothetical protein
MKLESTTLILLSSHAIPALALTSTGGHLSYASSFPAGAEWLSKQVAAGKGEAPAPKGDPPAPKGDPPAAKGSPPAAKGSPPAAKGGSR